ncbi:MAG: TSUP family transporter, partial [Flavobacteriales bacterium]
MEQYVIIGCTALAASLLTFFSGFGLGTILLPVMLIYFPPTTAIGITAIVHFLNNLTKLSLLFNHVNWNILIRFGIPAVVGSLLGAVMLFRIENLIMYSYTFNGEVYTVNMISGLLAFVMIGFTLQEILSKSKSVSTKWIIPGGLITGFFGGLTGHQGALRSAFLLQVELSKEMFLATGVAIACLIDITRLGVYSQNINIDSIQANISIIVVAVAAATAGAVLGKYL